MGNFDRRSISPLFKMETTIWLSLVLVLVTLALPVSPSEPRVVCYYTNWSVYRPGTARFNPQNINPYLCTHLIYAFGGFTKDNTLKPFDKYQDIEKGGYAKFTGLKTYNKQLKTMLAIGGWNEGSSRFSPMVAAKDRRKEFVRNAIKFLRQNHFDGLDLDWEYPAFRDGGKPKDRENYARLVKELREEFERESQKTGKPRLLLTMAVPAGIEYIQKGFDVKTLNRYLDWMNLLTYDYHSAFEPAVNHHAPLFPLEEPNEYSVDNELNIDHTIKFYLENGADREKLVLGIPTYGRSYTLFNPDAFEIGAPADGPGDQGDATREKGYLAYYEICEALKPKTSKKKRQISSDEESDEEESEEEEEEDLEWTVMHPNPDAMGPVAYRGNQWVGYDDIDIVKKKADYVAENGLGGIMFWSIDNDDFRGTCHGKPYPLIEAAKEAYIVKLGSTDNTIVTDKPKTAVNRRTRPRKPAAITTTTQAPAVKEKSHKRKSGTTVVSTTPSWSANTPEPPTTPDPGSDFKCTDEGFFQHPRDCKKYFWCLDSGPSNLGIVAHQFTCPSGLFFNKAADSCDFARNVLCKKPAAETTTTSKPTTTRAPTTTTTTTRRPVKLSTKSSVAFRTTTTTTTTPEPEVSEEDVLDDIAEVEAEDPKVIKELIELIKKVGGVEQLEKQLHLAEGQASTDGAQTTTPASFNKKLYQKVLERTRKNKFGVISPNEGNSQNSRRGPQNAGLEASDDKDRLLKKDRPQYTTINRSRSRVSTTEEPLESEEEDEPETDTAQSRLRSLETEVKSTTGKPLQYVNIRRARPTVSTSDTADDTASRNALFERSETFVAISEAPNSLDVANAKRESIPEYVTIRRQRLTTEESTTAQYQESEEETELQETALEREISSPPSQQPQYTSILRTRSTTLAPLEEPSSPEPTTVLAVQISSLLNSPSSTEVETPDTETAEVTESTQPATTTTSTTTTTTAAPATRAPPRRAVLRRRGSTSTTTSTATPTTVTQVSSRNYAFVRRRRPLSRPNDITSDSDETVDLSRKVRSTTPNSREAELSSNVEPRVISRTRSRFTTQSDDSVPAAASQVSRGHFRPTLNRDDLLSLTPLDTAEEPVAFVQRPNFQRPERRFRPRTSTTAADKVEDSEVSAATVEVGSASILPRGRNRFLLNSATEEPEQSDIAKPTIRKFSPRPFGRTTSPSSRTDDIIIQENIDEVITKKTPARLSFGRVRPSSSTGELQPRKLPFLTRLSSTPQSLVTENDEPEDKNEDISLSESSLTENEHFTEEVTETPKRRIIIKKLRSGSTTTIEGSIPTEVTPGEGGRPRFRVIRRKPSSTTPIDDNITPSLETSTSSIPRIRKVIRKKLRPSSEEPDVSIRNDPLEQTTKEATSESISNYGEKSRTTISLTSTLPSTLPSIDSEEVQVNNDEENKEVLNKDDLGTNRKEEVITTQESLKEETKREEIKNDQTKEEHKVLDGLGENVIKQNSNILSTVDTSTPQIQTDISQEVKTEVGTKIEPEIIVETQKKTLELSDTKAPDPDSEIKSGESSEISEDQDQANDNIENDKNDSTSTTTTQPSSSSTRSRLPYRPPKRLFTSTTESSSPSSSRTFSRKYNPGAYTRPAERSTESSRLLVPASRRPLYSARTFTRRPFYTTKTTPKPTEEEEEEYSDEDEVLDEEPENKLVLVPSSQLFTRKPENSVQNDDENYTDSSENEEEEDKVTPIHKSTAASRKPIFKPRIVNSNTFRTSSSTTELPKRLFGQNKTIFNRFNGSKVNEPKKRVQNVPLGYVAPQINTTEEKTTEASTTANTSISEDISTTISSDNTDLTTEDDDYLTMTETSVTDTDSTNTVDISTTDDSDTTTEEMRFDINLDDYLEYTEGTTNEPTTQDSNIQDSTTQGFTSNTPVYTKNIIKDNTSVNTDYSQNLDVTTENFPEVTTSVPQQPPVVKTQFDKLFSVSRVVEVNSKLDKHRLNKNNETTLIEEGKIMVEKKPMVDKIGEVSRFSLIKIVEDEIPIYLTKLGHVYPVDNPPDNPIRIDEARNARALVNFSDAPKENLIASESMNEAYRHVNMISDPFKKDRSKVVVEHVTTSDDFLSYINDEKVGKKTEDYQAISAPWQFVPAAYENEKNKAAKQFEIITPRNMLTDPSTLPVEALFKTEIPLMARKVNDDNQPYVVYSAAVPTQKNDANIVQLKVLNAEAGRSIISFAKGQEFNGAAVGETSRNSPINIAVLPKSTISSSSFTTTEKTTNTSPLIELLTTSQTTTLSPEEPTTATTTELPSTTETILEDLTTVKISPLDSKRKFAFPRRPIGLKSLNFTRPTSAPRVVKKANITVVSNANQKVNKTSNFASRFSINRAQNVPIDIKKKGNTPKVGPKSYTTELPRTTSERKLNFKPLRPNLRPSFIPRKNTVFPTKPSIDV